MQNISRMRLKRKNLTNRMAVKYFARFQMLGLKSSAHYHIAGFQVFCHLLSKSHHDKRAIRSTETKN